jgi:hypothetical protein
MNITASIIIKMFIIVFCLIAITALINNIRKEKFRIINEKVYYNHDDQYPNYYTHTEFPFMNTQMGTTRNMSYDLRGDYYIPKMWTPFNMSSYVPIRNRSI